MEPRQLLSAGVWSIVGDRDASNRNDVIVVQVSPDDSALLQAVVNGQVTAERAIDTVRAIRVKAGAGDDVVRVLRDGGPSVRVIVSGGSGSDVIETGGGDDLLYGGGGDDVLRGGDGQDTLHGQGGQDKLFGEAGDDRLLGGASADRLNSGDGANLVSGGAGADWIYGRPGFDRLRSPKRDTVVQAAAELTTSATPQELRQWFIDWTVQEWSHLLGQEATWYNPWWGGPVPMERQVVAMGSGLAVLDSGNGAQPQPGQDYSGTNSQVQGVDEADIVKTNGQTIYTLVDGQLLAIAALPADEPSVLSRTEVEGAVQSLYLQGNRLTVLSTSGGWWGGWLPVEILPVESGPGGDAMAMASMPRFREWSQPQVIATVLDVSDPANPRLVEKTTVDGWLISSRAIDGRVVLVMQNSIPLPPPEIVTDESGVSRYESAEAFQQRLEASFDDLALPGFSAGDGQSVQTTGTLMTDLATYLPDEPPGRDLISLVELNMLDDIAGPVGGASTVGLSGQVYASTDSLYLAAESWLPAGGDDAWGSATFLYRFDLTQPGLPLVAEGAVPGHVINQFAMDQHDGYFRLATTQWGGAARTNNLFVLEQEDGMLNPVGAVTGLAHNENLYGARFLGDTAYLVTFRTIDPLFVVDLSDPLDPHVTGELKIPGFSNYLHPVGDGFLLGLGRDADPETGATGGLQVSLFDVRDPQHPVRTDALGLGTNQWSWSDAIWDHHAFSFFPESGILALPVSSYSESSLTQLEVITVSPEDGLDLLGTIDYEAPVLRSLRIADKLYSLSSRSLKVNQLADPSVELANLSLVEVPDSES